LPRLRIEGANKVRKIVFNEYPGASDSCPRNLAYFGSPAQFFRMATKENGRLLEA